MRIGHHRFIQATRIAGRGDESCEVVAGYCGPGGYVRIVQGQSIKTPLIERFTSVLCGPRVPAVGDPNLLMDTSGSVKVYYAPFKYINPSARIMLIGGTLRPTQMANANNEARRSLLAGKSNEDAIQAAKSVGAFSGEPLRSNLINQLNHWGFHK